MNTIFNLCCDIIHKLSDLFGISYSACNILIFLHILPLIYIIITIWFGISGFFKRSKIFGTFCIVSSLPITLYLFEIWFRLLSEYTYDVNSFNLSVERLRQHAQLFNCSYQEINIIYFVIIPILYIGGMLLLIFSNHINTSSK